MLLLIRTILLRVCHLVVNIVARAYMKCWNCKFLLNVFSCFNRHGFVRHASFAHPLKVSWNTNASYGDYHDFQDSDSATVTFSISSSPKHPDTIEE